MDFLGLQLRECAIRLLQENGKGPLHCRWMASEVQRRGYRGRLDAQGRSAAELLKNRYHCLFEIMRRDPTFEHQGHGQFSLSAQQ